MEQLFLPDEALVGAFRKMAAVYGDLMRLEFDGMTTTITLEPGAHHFIMGSLAELATQRGLLPPAEVADFLAKLPTPPPPTL